MIGEAGEDVNPPEKLRPDHNVSGFDSRVPSLDDWLRRRALQNQISGASQTYVISVGARVVGYYALANGAVALREATGRVRRNTPDPVPVMVIGRLAVDKAFQGRGLGQALLRDAVLRTVQAADIAGIRAMLVHAISEDAKLFYERRGFRPSPLDPMTLMVTVADAVKSLAVEK